MSSDSAAIVTDPVRFHTISNYLSTTAREMALAISHSAYSALISGTRGMIGDCDAAILDRDGALIATDETSVVHLASLPCGLRFVLEAFDVDTVEDGDLFVNNDPHRGGLHGNDVMLFKPVFAEGELVLWVANIAHITDVGGMSPGGMAFAATTVFAEGLVIPPTKLASRGVLNEAVVDLIAANSRQPHETRGDLLALMAGVHTGEQRMRVLIDRYGVPTLRTVLADLRQYTARVARNDIVAMVDGTYRAECWIDDDGVVADEPYVVRAAVTISGDELTIDLTGSSPQAVGPINSSEAQTITAITYAVRCVVARAAPLNEGLWDSYDVVLPRGSVVYPEFPAACNTRMSSTTPSVVEAVLWALSSAKHGSVGIAGSGVPDVHAINPRDSSEYWLHFEAEWGGSGARHCNDGVASGGTPMLGSGGGMIPIETQELLYDFRCERYQLRRDSGGPGQFRGGPGIQKDYVFLRPCSVSARTDRWRFPPAGRAGGEAGRPGAFVLNPGAATEAWLTSKFADLAVSPGDVISFRTMGGGGYGPAFERPPELVLSDVIAGTVSLDAARADYGVVLTDDAGVLSIDELATQQERSSRS